MLGGPGWSTAVSICPFKVGQISGEDGKVSAVGEVMVSDAEHKRDSVWMCGR